MLAPDEESSRQEELRFVAEYEAAQKKELQQRERERRIIYAWIVGLTSLCFFLLAMILWAEPTSAGSARPIDILGLIVFGPIAGFLAAKIFAPLITDILRLLSK